MGIGHYTPKSKIEIIKIDALDAQQSNQSDKHGFLLVIDTDRLCDANVVPKTEQIYQKKGENVSCEFVSRGIFSKVIKISLPACTRSPRVLGAVLYNHRSYSAVSPCCSYRDLKPVQAGMNRVTLHLWALQAQKVTFREQPRGFAQNGNFSKSLSRASACKLPQLFPKSFVAGSG
jgi:hypothetical protein